VPIGFTFGARRGGANSWSCRATRLPPPRRLCPRRDDSVTRRDGNSWPRGSLSLTLSAAGAGQTILILKYEEDSKAMKASTACE